MAIPERVKTLMKKYGLEGVNKPKRLRNDPSGKSHVVMASENGKYKLIKFGEKGAETFDKLFQKQISSFTKNKFWKLIDHFLIKNL